MLLNEGSDYNSATGQFTCDIPGLYFFSVTLTKSSSASYITCTLYVSSTQKLFMYVLPSYVSGSEHGRQSTTMAGAFHLNKGETAHLGKCSEEESFHGFYSSFSGFLIKADIM